MLKYEVLPGFPAYGPIPLPFSAGGAWSGHSEGMVIRFFTNTGEAWFGNSQQGSSGCQAVLEHPDGQHLVVVARGQGYIVDPEEPGSVSRLFDNIQHILSLPERRAILISDGLGFEAINKDGVWWQSGRISWDEIRNIEIKGAILRGEASKPALKGNEWFPFTLNLDTGHCADGIYSKTMQSAIRVTRSQDRS